MEKKDTCKKCDEYNQRILDLENKWKRAVADYRNLEKRTEEEKSIFMEFANFILIGRILELLDCLEDAQNHIKDEGLNLCLKKFKDFLQSQDVSEIKCLDELFDSTKMEAVDTVDGEENKVIEVRKKGYMINNRVLRPSKVVVGRKE